MCEAACAGDAASIAESSGVRVVMLHLPEDEGEGLGFKLTRTMWDPYPWVREVSAGGRAAAAGLRSGDCVLQADGRDLLGLPVGQVAGVIRGDGGGHGVSLLVWSCGASPQDDPELLWSAGGGARGERSRRALGGVLRALACCVCSATAAATAPRTRAAQCSRGHLYCAGCRARLQRCALCRESLPPLETPQARNLVAEQLVEISSSIPVKIERTGGKMVEEYVQQWTHKLYHLVFEAIASVYELKDPLRAPNPSASASSSPNRSPLPTNKTPQSVSQRNSPSGLRKMVQFGLTPQLHHGSDISLNRPKPNTPEFVLKRPTALNVQALRQDIGSQTDLTQDVTPKNEREQSLPRAANVCQSFDSCQHAGFSNGCQKSYFVPYLADHRCHGSGCWQRSQDNHKCCQNDYKLLSSMGQSSENCQTATDTFNYSQGKSDNCQTSPDLNKRCQTTSDSCNISHDSPKCSQTRSDSCQSAKFCCQTSPNNSNCCQSAKFSCQTFPDNRNCCQTRMDSCLSAKCNCQTTTVIPHCCQSRLDSGQTAISCGTSRCCHPQMFHSQQALNLVPLSLSSACGLPHRLVARLRPASSMADLRRTHAPSGEMLSKSWSDIHVGESASTPRAGSMDNLPGPGTQTPEEEAFLIDEQSPVLVWTYPQSP